MFTTCAFALLRFISLWFSNSSDLVINGEVSKLLKDIPSHKFVYLMYQIAARLSAPNRAEEYSFATVLSELVSRCAREHPLHTMPILLALVNADRDEREIGGGN